MSDLRRATPAMRRTRWHLLALLLLLPATTALPACRKKPPTAVKPPAAKITSPAELAHDAESAKQSLEALKPLVGALNAQFQELHQKYDALPPALPGFGETRGKFYETAEGLGTMNAKLVWLSGRIDSALRAGDGAALAETSRDIAHTYDEVRQVDRITAELVREMPPFLEQAEQARAGGLSSCE